LLKGYKIALTVEAADYRGTFKGAKIKGETKRSEEWIFAVSDKAGVQEAVNRLSQQTDKKLDEILRAQVEAGR
jgi:adenylate cyclase class IV